MASMTSTERSLTEVRDIVWTHWDPIGLRNAEGGWAADEYDEYLLQVLTMLRQGADQKAAADYLIQVESVHMGLGKNATASARATKTVSALRNLSLSY
ncbi:hypothetical protein ACFSM5_02755 [Lacibacterium aquatile]|uniref:Uncharacterized protein n=1 Tax=Lacibacterium aquatile TaxID=1168082 RepID=A0ABW5DR71_9PROT